MVNEHEQDPYVIANSGSPELKDQEQYWQRKLASELPVLDTCLDSIRPPAKTYHREQQVVHFSDADSVRIHNFCQHWNYSLLILLLAGLKAVWVRHGADETLVIGSAIARNIENPQEEDASFYTNVLPLCTDLSGNPTVAEFLASAATSVREARQNCDFPFSRMIPLSGYDVASSRSPVFQTMLLAFDLFEQWKPVETAPSSEEISDYMTACDAVFIAFQSDGRLSIECEYDSELFREATIRRCLLHMRNLVQGMVTSNNCQLLDLPMLDQEEVGQVLYEWNQTHMHTPNNQTFVELFQERVAECPDTICAQMGKLQLNYEQLNRFANRIAHSLRDLGIGPDQVVAVLDERNLNLLIVMLGVWKAGAAYVPLDPRHPPKRIATILKQSQAPVVVTGHALASLLHETQSELSHEPQLPVLITEELLRQSTNEHNPAIVADPGCLAYTIFTSGSTGAPKGAMVEQRGMVNHLFAKIRDLGLGQDDIVAQTASQCFDISVWQFMAPLLVAGRVHVVEDAVAYDTTRLLDIVEHYGITILQSVPSFLHVVLDESLSEKMPLNQLRWLVATGEALPIELCQRWFRRHTEIPIINAYGPTECSDDVTHHVIESGHFHNTSVPIGRPLANTQIYVVDEQLRPQSPGVQGELLVGGIGVGRGYCGSSDLTADAFIPNPFADIAGTRLYRTRDSARWINEGQLEYLGRSDYQLKVRGFRIELREIELLLSQYPEVQDAVVTDHKERDGNVTLTAYLVSSKSPRIADLHEFARNRLPAYMLPAAYVILEAFPRTANGKIDRGDLPTPTYENHPRDDGYEAPCGATEVALAKKWAELFDLDRVGRHENFLDLGGHSLLATQLVSWIYEVFQIKLSVRDVFEAPFVDSLGEQIDMVLSAAEQSQSPGSRDDEETVI